jgi:cobalt-zinc-cadmium efflux system membrane fusion protein
MFNLYKGLLIIFITTVLTSCNRKAPDENVDTDEPEEVSNTVVLSASQVKNVGIVLGHIEQRQINGTIKVNGVLDVPPQQLISIGAPMGGFVKKTMLLQGTRVKKGQVIATIENLDFIQIQQDYLEAKNQMEFTKADFERQQKLSSENINSQKTLQLSKTNYATWQAKYNGLSEKLKVLNLNAAAIETGDMKSSIDLYSPINGYVTEVNVNVGKFVNSTDILFEIVDTEHLHAELTVFEKDIPKLKIGQKVRFTLANETKERTATVHLIGRKIGADRTIRIHCHIDNEDTELLPGMYLKALVETGGALVNALPNEAIIDYVGKKYIFIASDETKNSTDKKFLITEIQTGNSESGFTEIQFNNDLTGNANVVVKGAYSLISKMKNSEEEE